MTARELTPYRSSYRGLEILSFPSPGAGGAVIESLNLLERFAPETLRSEGVDRLQVMAEALHIAIEDHRSLAPDPNLPQPSGQPAYLNKRHAAERAALIEPGRPVPAEAFRTRSFRPSLESQTAHLSVIDENGNAVSLTQTLGRFFGNKVVAHELGFLYNTLLGGTDPTNPDHLRPLSILPLDCAPTIVVADDEPLLVLGSAGSSRIPGAVATVISNLVDRGLSLDEAVAAPRVLWSDGDNTVGLLLEIRSPIREQHARSLAEMGYTAGIELRLPAPYEVLSKFGAVNAVRRDPETGRLTGVGDPRRDADARGL
jgi:gamma-glutamyltranspeptidase/glutathione hydrolase